MGDLCAVVEDKCSSSNKVFWKTLSEAVNHEAKDFQISEAQDMGDSCGIDSSSSVNDFGFFSGHEYSSEEGYLLSSTGDQQKDNNLSYLDNLRFEMVVSPALDDQNMVDLDLDVVQRNQNVSSFPIASLHLLNNYGNEIKRINKEAERNDGDLVKVRKLSTEDVMRLAGTRFIQSSSSTWESDSLISHPYDSHFSGLTEEEKNDVELAESLLACAEKLGFQQFERASELLEHCESMSSKTGNPVKRVVSYFADALRERINRERGRLSSSASDSDSNSGSFSPPKVVIQVDPVLNPHYQKYIQEPLSFDPDKSMLAITPTSIACHEELPFSQVVEFAGIQAIIENVADSKKIHIVDLGIRKGSQWTILMQALESKPVELLKITAVGTTMRETLEATGARLTSFAHTMKIPFSFKIVMVTNMLYLNEDLLEAEEEETIAVYAKFALRAMIPRPEELEGLMRVMRDLNPVVMVVTEVEANHNSKSFVKRFTEALFFFSAMFDCLESCMKREDANRLIVESLYMREGIRNIVGVGEGERKIRNVKIEVWRAFFGRYGMVEEKLSMSSLFQAEMVAKRFECGRFCTFEMNGNCLLCGWKGTPLHSLSVWKFR